MRGYHMALHAPEEKVRNQVYNLGSDRGNYTKDEIVNLILEQLSGVVVRYKDISYGGEQRDLVVSYDKIERELGFGPQKSAKEGVEELVNALRTGLIRNPYDRRYRNAESFVQ